MKKENDYLLSEIKKAAVRLNLFDLMDIEDLEILKLTQPELQEYTLKIRNNRDEVARYIYAIAFEMTDFSFLSSSETEK